ncbi:MAG TPA: alpha-amylase family glycosyl hydrolase [Chthoniobacteraceae bacterium]|jgi:glycosidase
MFFLRCFVPLLLLARLAAAETVADRPWNHDIIYFALTDRFYDGDPDNDVPAGSDPALYDKSQSDLNKYQGGDLRGLELALKNGYFKALGVTAIWITPPVRNVWLNKQDGGGPKTGYHGYWAQDFLDIDPHLTSRKSLDGSRAYPDTRDGRMQHYKDFVALAHAQGIKIIQDIVCHHAGPTFFYDANGNGKFDMDDPAEWIQPFKREGFYANAIWANNPQWNQVQTAPSGPVTILGKTVNTTGVLATLDAYARKGFSPGSLGKSDGEERECDFYSLRSLWTEPGSKLFDQRVNEFVEIYAFYVQEIGVDGFRIDTIKHVNHAFWDAFTDRLRKRLGPERAKHLFLFGEVYDGNPQKAGEYTYHVDRAQNPGPCLDSVLNFPLCFALRSYLRTSNGPFGNGQQLESAMKSTAAGDSFNPTPGLDGLNAQQKAVNFSENHDGLNRFRVGGISERNNLLANAFLLTSEGIPCLYYGTEAALEDTRGKVGRDSETGRTTFIPAGHPERFDAAREGVDFKAIAGLASLRQQLPALNSGAEKTLWVDSPSSDADDGIYAFVRYLQTADQKADTAQTILVVLNASDKSRTTGIPGHTMRIVGQSGHSLMQQGDKLQRVAIPGLDKPNAEQPTAGVQWNGDVPEAQLLVEPQSVNLYRVVRGK